MRRRSRWCGTCRPTASEHDHQPYLRVNRHAVLLALPGSSSARRRRSGAICGTTRACRAWCCSSRSWTQPTSGDPARRPPRFAVVPRRHTPGMPSVQSAITQPRAVRPSGEVSFAGFSSLVLVLSAWARAHALQSPQFRSPPRLVGVTRSVRRAPGCRPVVSIRLRDRDRSEVVRDMVDGLLAVNPELGLRSGSAVACVDELRRAAIAHLLSNDVGSSSPMPLRGAGSGPTGRLAA